jgi:hypothetical protein
MMWGSHSWLQPPFQAAVGSLHCPARASQKGGCSQKWLPHSEEV